VPFGIGIWEVLILLLVLLLVFGPKRLPEMGKQLGKGMREFKDSIAGKDDEPVETQPTQPSPALPPAAEPEPDDAQARERDAVH
jgi:sec-independent protein translocase protein TatA